MTPGIWQIVIVILLVMVLFGAGRIPTIMENLAKGVKSFKKGLQDEDQTKLDANTSQSNEAAGQDETKTK